MGQGFNCRLDPMTIGQTWLPSSRKIGKSEFQQVSRGSDLSFRKFSKGFTINGD